MTQYFVVGGEYNDVHFCEAVGGDEKWYGPFDSYELARQEWAKHKWPCEDESSVRFRIERIDTEAPPPCTD